ncbi:MAG: aldo/keto reductase [Phycisphaerales bacterium]|nr:aldo/keto reductase [Phycisphaerales bacterium]
MALRPLGSTGIAVSPIGLGTVKLGRNQGVKYPEPFDIPDDAAAARLLDLARSLGVNLLDTAPAYGRSEERLGALLAGRRDEWVICTKAGEEFEDGRSRFDFSPRAIGASVDRSLRRLRTDRLDVVLLHSDGDDEEIIERSGALEALERAKAAGKVRAVGVSTKTPAGAALAARRCDVVMLTLNPSSREDEPALDVARAHGAGVLVKKALSSGHLGAAPPGEDPAEHALGFVLRRPEVSSVVVGTISPERLRANVAAALRAVTCP